MYQLVNKKQIMIVGIWHLVVVKCFISKKCTTSNFRKSELVWVDAEWHKGKILYHLYRMISSHLAICRHGEQEEEIGLSCTNGSYNIKRMSFAVLQQWEMRKTCLSQLLSNLCLPLNYSGCEWPLIFSLKPWKTCQNIKQQSSDSNCITSEYRFSIVQLHQPAQ
jgi:hypothetical protein